MTARELREFKARHRLTQDKLGAILGHNVDRRAVSKYEHGILTLSHDDAAKLYEWERLHTEGVAA